MKGMLIELREKTATDRRAGSLLKSQRPLAQGWGIAQSLIIHLGAPTLIEHKM